MRSDNSVLGRVIRKVLSGREIKQSLKEGSNALRKYWGKESPYGNTQAVNLGFPEVLLEGWSCLRIEERESGGRWGVRGDCCCSVAKSCRLFETPWTAEQQDFPVLHCLPEFVQSHVHCVDDAIQPSHPSVFASIRVFFQWVSSLHQVVKVLELQLQHQSFQWVFRVDFL